MISRANQAGDISPPVTGVGGVKVIAIITAILMIIMMMTMASCRCFICCLYVLQCGSFISLICVLWWREACRRSQPATFSSTPSSFFHPSGSFPLLIMSAHKTSRQELPQSASTVWDAPFPPYLSLPLCVCLSLVLIIIVLINLWYALLCNYPPPLPSSPPSI